MEEIEWATRSLKSGKAAATDMETSKMIKSVGISLRDSWVSLFCNLC